MYLFLLQRGPYILDGIEVIYLYVSQPGVCCGLPHLPLVANPECSRRETRKHLPPRKKF